MNEWACMLAALPATHQRLIARSQRISLPRGADAPTRVERLRRALCRPAAVRSTFAALDAPTREAVRALAAIRGGIRPDELFARYGALRPLRDLAADPRPRTITERLALLGWLVERPAARFHPARWLIPGELRHWLPAPVTLADRGPAPAPGFPPALRAAHAILLTCAARPLPLRADGRPRRAGIRLLAGQLAPFSVGEAGDLARFVLPLLETLGLVSAHHGQCALAPSGQRFLARPYDEQLDRLRRAWANLPRPDDWLLPLLRDSGGIDWPLLRRRLLVWAEALPAGRLVDPAEIFPALAGAFGPLADAHTHGFRVVGRAPWQPRRSAAVLDAALRGPLRWLGIVHWLDDRRVFRAMPDLPDPAALPWRCGERGTVSVPHTGVDSSVLRLLPFAEWQAADAVSTTYRLTRASIARAAGQGRPIDALRALLVERAGSAPDWGDLLETRRPPLRIVRGDVLLADQPGVLARAARVGAVRRALGAQIAPGVALVAPELKNRLVRALARQGVAVEHEQATDSVPAPAGLSPGECAELLAACAYYRQHLPPDAPFPPSDLLEARLRAGLTRALRAALDEAAAPRPLDPPEPAVGERAPLTETLGALRAAIRGRDALAIAYDTAGCGGARWRTVRPLALERHGDTWLVRAYCALRRAERTFRVDRIIAVRRE